MTRKSGVNQKCQMYLTKVPMTLLKTNEHVKSDSTEKWKNKNSKKGKRVKREKGKAGEKRKNRGNEE